MRKIVLYSSHVDRAGAFRDAGETLTVGAEDTIDTDLTNAVADDLIESGRAVTITTARTDGALEAPAQDPLDHDGDGRKGGSKER